jgi:hypothetical protein
MNGRPGTALVRSLACMAVASALLLAGCASRPGTEAIGGSPGFNAAGPMEVHGSPSEGAGKQVSVPDVRGEPFEDAAHAVLDAGLELGTWLRWQTGIPGGL